jgi:hypothetical protein
MMRHGEWFDEATGLEYRSQFVIFIDDLDRCPADKVVEVLKVGADGQWNTLQKCKCER